MTLKIDGLFGFSSDVRNFVKRFPDESNRLANRVMLKIESEAIDESPVITGRLRNSMYSKLMGFTTQSYVSTNTDYAIFPHMRGQNPNYMGKAIKNSESFIDREIDNMLDKL